MKPKLYKLLDNLTSEEYHGAVGTYSSSQLKLMLDDPKEFYDTYIAKSLGKKQIDAFGIGTYFHTAILEPHLLKKETVVYEGVRMGAKWSSFQLKNSGRNILTPAMKARGDFLVENIKNSKESLNYLKGVKPELSLFVKIYVANGRIYSKKYNKVLGPLGWEDCDNIPSGGKSIILKVRADGISKKYIIDLKSTSGDVFSRKSVTEKVSAFSYELSAAMYLDLFELVTGKKRRFVWLFSSKDQRKAKPWIVREDNVRVGRAKWAAAVVELVEHIRADWEFSNMSSELGPSEDQLVWLNKGV